VGITLDEAIKEHIEKERKFLHPLKSEAILGHTELHNRIFERTPRVTAMIEKGIAEKKKLIAQCNDSIKTDELSTEIEAMQILRYGR